MGTIYKFKQGAHLRGDAQAVGERLAALEANGKLTPEEVVHDAQHEDSVLHPLFEWDDGKAAYKYRLQQAGHLIRCVTVVMESNEPDAPRDIRAFVPVSGSDETRSYVPTIKALSDADMRKQVLAQAHAELGAVARKYRELRELSDVVDAIDKVGQILAEGQPS